MAKPNPRTKNGHRRRELRRWWKAQGLPCALCGQPIDYDLPAGNPLSFEVDEIIRIGVIAHKDYRPTPLGQEYLDNLLSKWLN